MLTAFEQRDWRQVGDEQEVPQDRHKIVSLPPNEDSKRRPTERDDPRQPPREEIGDWHSTGEELRNQKAGQGEKERHAHGAGRVVEQHPVRTERHEVRSKDQENAGRAPAIKDWNSRSCPSI